MKIDKTFEILLNLISNSVRCIKQVKIWQQIILPIQILQNFPSYSFIRDTRLLGTKEYIQVCSGKVGTYLPDRVEFSQIFNRMYQS